MRLAIKRMATAVIGPLIGLLLLLLTLKGALALTITSVTAPVAIAEGETLTVSFAADQAATYRIIRDGAVVADANAYTAQLGYDDAGLTLFVFEASNGTATVNATRTVEILDTPLTIAVEEPGESDYASSVVPVELTTGIPADFCYTVVGGNSNTLAASSPTRFAGALTLADGLHTIALKCNRNGEVAEELRTVKVDTTPPTMALGPSGTVSADPVLLTATTNEVSLCRYGESEAAYDLLPDLFAGSASLAHTAELEVDEGSNAYYVACRDVYGNTASPQRVAFTVQRGPSASVSVDGKNPHKAGRYAVLLRVSEELQELPTLELTYQGGSSSQLALTQKDALTYEGIVIVAEDAGVRVASFEFSGKDLSGLAGTRITEGELFLVDTVKPPMVETFNAVNGTQSVELSWYYDAEDDVRFNLYRATESGVDYTDFLTTTIGDRYTDRAVGDAPRYYYRIAPVDEAGNVGELSREEWASPAAAGLEEATIILEPELILAVEQEQERIDYWLLDAERILSGLKTETDPVLAAFIRSFSLIDEAQRSVAAFKSADEKLEQLKRLGLSREEFNARLTTIKQEAETARSRMPKDVAVISHAEYEEAPDGKMNDALADRLLEGSDLDRAAFMRQALSLQEAARVSTALTVGSVVYADGAEKRYTLVRKHLVLADGAQAIVALETIPGGIVEKASALLFLGARPIVLAEQPPLLQYSFDTVQETDISYAVEAELDAVALRAGGLLLFPKPSGAGSVTPVDQEERITGGAVSAISEMVGGMTGGQGLILLLGVVIIVGLLVYYLRLQSEDELPVAGERSAGYGRVAAAPSTGWQALTVPGGLTPSGPFSPSGQFNPAGSYAGSAPSPVRTVIVERKDEPLAGLLLRGHRLIDEVRFDDALHFYKRALTRYGQEEFSTPRLREAVRDELELLHAKLLLHATIGRAKQALLVEDLDGLGALLDALRDQASGIGDGESRLLEHAKAQYGYLYAQYAGMKRQDHHRIVRELRETPRLQRPFDPEEYL